MSNIKWDKIFDSLEKWYNDISADAADPSVSTIARNYRQDAWAVLASTIISLRTKDEVTAVSSRRLLEKARTPAALNVMKEEDIEKLIYPAGFYRNKAASLKRIAKILIEQYGGKVPASMEALLDLPGVGRKTANLVLNEAFDIDAICVDIHVHRISNRCGWLFPSTANADSARYASKDPHETEMILREILPVKYWKRINFLLVLYGQKICRPVSPFCSCCVIGKYCSRNGVERSR